MNLEKERIQILQDNFVARQQAVMHYQINIDNYHLAIEKIEQEHSDNSDMKAFSDHLKELLRTSLIEQTKEKIMMKVLEEQLKGVE